MVRVLPLASNAAFQSSKCSVSGLMAAIRRLSIASSSDGSKLAAVNVDYNNGSYGGSIWTNASGTWAAVPCTSGHRWTSIISSSDGSKLAAVNMDHNNGSFTGSIWTNASGTWAAVPGSSGHQWSSITYSADGSNLAAVEAYGSIWTNASGTWASVPGTYSPNWTSIVYSADGSKLAAANSQYYGSDPKGSIWINAGGTINGDATFYDNSTNRGTINGTTIINEDVALSAVNQGGRINNVVFNGASYNDQEIPGNATFTTSAFDSYSGIPNADPTGISNGASISGTIEFTADSSVTFTLHDSDVWTADTSSWVFDTSGQSWTFNDSSSNAGTIAAAVFNGQSSNQFGTVTGDVTFNVSYNNVVDLSFVGAVGGALTVNGDFSFDGSNSWTGDDTGIAGTRNYIFHDSSSNYGIVTGTATFAGSAYTDLNIGSVGSVAFAQDVEFITDGSNSWNYDTSGWAFGGTPDWVFDGSSVNNSTISGNATFNDGSSNKGAISGNATFTASTFESDQVQNADPTGLSNLGSIGGTIEFTSSSPVTFSLLESAEWAADTSPWVFDVSGQSWTFNDSSSNAGTIAAATFNDQSINEGIVHGSILFNDSSTNIGTAVFTNSVCLDGLTLSSGEYYFASGAYASNAFTIAGATIAGQIRNSGSMTFNSGSIGDGRAHGSIHQRRGDWPGHQPFARRGC